MNNFWRLALWAIGAMVLTVGAFYLTQALGAEDPTVFAAAITFTATITITLFTPSAFTVIAAAFTAIAVASYFTAIITANIAATAHVAVGLTIAVAIVFAAVAGIAAALAFAAVNKLHLKHRYALGMLMMEAGWDHTQ